MPINKPPLCPSLSPPPPAPPRKISMSSRQDLRTEIVRLTKLLEESNRQCTILQNKIKKLERRAEPDYFIIENDPNVVGSCFSLKLLVQNYLPQITPYFKSENPDQGIYLDIASGKKFRSRTLIVTSYNEHGVEYYWQEDANK